MTKTMNQSVRVKILFCGWWIPVTLAALSMLLSSEKQGIPPFRRPSYLLTNRLSSVCFLYFSRFEVVCKRQGIVSMVLQQGIFLIIFEIFYLSSNFCTVTKQSHFWIFGFIEFHFLSNLKKNIEFCTTIIEMVYLNTVWNSRNKNYET